MNYFLTCIHRHVFNSRKAYSLLTILTLLLCYFSRFLVCGESFTISEFYMGRILDMTSTLNKFLSVQNSVTVRKHKAVRQISRAEILCLFISSPSLRPHHLWQPPFFFFSFPLCFFFFTPIIYFLFF